MTFEEDLDLLPRTHPIQGAQHLFQNPRAPALPMWASPYTDTPIYI